MDVTVVTPLQAATMPAAATTPGHALTYAYDCKMQGAAEACRRQGIAFFPLVAETFGGWHGTAEAWLCPGKAHGADGGGGNWAHLGAPWDSPPTGQCRPPWQQSA